MEPMRSEVAMSTVTQHKDPVGAARAASTDWFSMACNILAPGTRHYTTNTVAIDWDAFDRLEGHGWEYRAWWVTPDGHRVESRTEDACLHEQRSRKLTDGSTVTCFPPSAGERPVLMLCPKCVGRGWTLETDEDGDPAQIDCRECHTEGAVPRPFAPLPFGITIEDLAGPEPAEPSERPF